MSEKEKTTVQKLSEREAQADDKITEVDKIKEQLVRIGIVLLADQVMQMSLIFSILPILQTRLQADITTLD